MHDPQQLDLARKRRTHPEVWSGGSALAGLNVQNDSVRDRRQSVVELWSRIRPWTKRRLVRIPAFALLGVVVLWFILGFMGWLIGTFLPGEGSIPFWGLQDYVQPITPTDRAALIEAEVETTAALINLFGSVVLAFTVGAALISAYLARKTLDHNRDELRTAQEFNQQQLRIVRDGQITDRFSKAIEQLGATRLDGQLNIEVRLGGIYALERIAQDSCRGNQDSEDWCRDHWPIMEVLTAYVRDNSRNIASETGNVISFGIENEDRDRSPKLPLPETTSIVTNEVSDPESNHLKLRSDIQSVLSVIGRRNEAQRESERIRDDRIDLSGAQLAGAKLDNAHLDRSFLSGTNFKGASLFEAHLENADLSVAFLKGADLTSASMRSAHVDEANLEGAYLNGADLENAGFVQAFMEGAILSGANLKKAGLSGAHLEKARLDHACLEEAFFTGTYLEDTFLLNSQLAGARLHNAIGLTQWQIDETFMNEQTILPKDVGPDGLPFRHSTAVPGRYDHLSGRKACAYISHGNRLLVVDQPGFQDAGYQVPEGKLGWFEQPSVGVLREAIETTGLGNLEIVRYLGDQWFEHLGSGKRHHRFFYHLKCNRNPPETWEHVDTKPPTGENESSLFKFSWWPLANGLPDLTDDLGARLPELLASLKSV